MPSGKKEEICCGTNLVRTWLFILNPVTKDAQAPPQTLQDKADERRSTNEELGEERKPRAVGTVTRRLAARLTACASERFHNRWRRHRLCQRRPTEKGGGGSAAMHSTLVVPSNISTHGLGRGVGTM